MRGKEDLGNPRLSPGVYSSAKDKIAPAAPKASAIRKGRMRNPPRRAYSAERSIREGARA